MLIILGIALITISVLFSYCACVISSRCSREEEKRETEISKRV